MANLAGVWGTPVNQVKVSNYLQHILIGSCSTDLISMARFHIIRCSLDNRLLFDDDVSLFCLTNEGAGSHAGVDVAGVRKNDSDLQWNS